MLFYFSYPVTGMFCRQTNAQQGVRGRANQSFTAPPAALFSCTVNGTFSFWRDKKRMWGWNCGFRKMPRYDWQREVRTKYAKRISALRTNLFCRSLRRGTFHRRKVPKDRWGVSMRHLGLRAALRWLASKHACGRSLTPGDSSSARGLYAWCIWVSKNKS